MMKNSCPEDIAKFLPLCDDTSASTVCPALDAISLIAEENYGSCQFALSTIRKLLNHPRLSVRIRACETMSVFALSEIEEQLLRIEAAQGDRVAIRKAAKRSLIRHWTRDETNKTKSDFLEIKAALSAYNITSFYHITSGKNLCSIQEHKGLLSRAELKRRSIENVTYVSNRESQETDSDCGSDVFVRLALHPNQPMFYQAESDRKEHELVVLEIDTEVAIFGTTLFSDENANASYAMMGPTSADFSKIRFDLFQRGYWDGGSEKRSWQAEILVLNSVPSSLIKGVCLYSDLTKTFNAKLPVEVRLNYREESISRILGRPSHK